MLRLLLSPRRLPSPLKVVGMATPGWVTSVLGTSVVILLGTAVLCFVGLFLSIMGGAHTVPAPSVTYRSFIARIAEFDGASWSKFGDPSLDESAASQITNALIHRQSRAGARSQFRRGTVVE